MHRQGYNNGMDRPKTWGRSRSLRIEGFDYSSPGKAYHVVIGSKDKKPLFVTNDLNFTILEALKKVISTHDYRLLCCCLMPDHLHALVQAGATPQLLSRMIRNFKALSKIEARVPLWQRGFYEHIVRTEESLETIANYILHNPVRAGLADNENNWPWNIRSW